LQFCHDFYKKEEGRGKKEEGRGKKELRTAKALGREGREGKGRGRVDDTRMI
jgi:hypothetical protein